MIVFGWVELPRHAFVLHALSTFYLLHGSVRDQHRKVCERAWEVVLMVKQASMNDQNCKNVASLGIAWDKNVAADDENEQ